MIEPVANEYQFLDRMVRDALSTEVDKIIEQEAKAAKERVEKKVLELKTVIASNVLKHFVIKRTDIPMEGKVQIMFEIDWMKMGGK